MVSPLLTETLWLCSGWVPSRSPMCQLDADLSRMPGMQLASTRFSCCQDSFTQDNNKAIKAVPTKNPLLPSEWWDRQNEGKSLSGPWIVGSSWQLPPHFWGC